MSVPPPSDQPPVLLVEDNASLLRVMTDLLEFEGYTTLPVSNGSEALQLLDRLPARPLLIVSDILMDDMDGCELLQRVRTHSAWPVTPFIFVSGKPEHDVLCPGLDFAPDGYVEKPFTLDQFIEAVRTAIMGGPAPT